MNFKEVFGSWYKYHLSSIDRGRRRPFRGPRVSKVLGGWTSRCQKRSSFLYDRVLQSMTLTTHIEVYVDRNHRRPVRRGLPWERIVTGPKNRLSTNVRRFRPPPFVFVTVSVFSSPFYSYTTPGPPDKIPFGF